MSVSRGCPSCKKKKILHQQRNYKKAPILPCEFTLIQLKALQVKILANPKKLTDVQYIKSAINTHSNNCNSLANEIREISTRYI